MKHIGSLLLLLVVFNLVDLLNEDSTILGTGVHKYSPDWTTPSLAAGVIFGIFELIYWIIIIFFT